MNNEGSIFNRVFDSFKTTVNAAMGKTPSTPKEVPTSEDDVFDFDITSMDDVIAFREQEASAIPHMKPTPGSSEEGVNGPLGESGYATDAAKAQALANPPARSAAENPDDDKDKTLFEKVQDAVANSTGNARCSLTGYFPEKFIAPYGLWIIFPTEDRDLHFVEMLSLHYGKPIDFFKSLPHEVVYFTKNAASEDVIMPVEDSALFNAILRDFWRRAEEYLKHAYSVMGPGFTSAIDTDSIVSAVQVIETSPVPEQAPMPVVATPVAEAEPKPEELSQPKPAPVPRRHSIGPRSRPRPH